MMKKDLRLLFGYLPTKILENNERHLNDILDKYDENKLALLLGAGVSSSIQLPDWPTLAKAMYRLSLVDVLKKCIGNDVVSDNITEIMLKFSKYPLCKGSPKLSIDSLYDMVELVSYISSSKPGVDHFSRRNQMYQRDIVMYLLKEAHDKYIKNETFPEDNTLILSLAKLMFPIESSTISECEMKIKHIITYNYDNLFEYILQKTYMNKRRPYNSRILSLNEDNYTKHDVDIDDIKHGSLAKIYHVHGYLPIAKYDNNTVIIGGNDPTGRIILDYESYEDIKDFNYHWCNDIQQEIFHKYCTLIVGFSGVDTNFRRLMRMTRSAEGITHYILLDGYKYLKDARKIADGKTEFKNKIATRILEDIGQFYKNTLNLTVIWTADGKKDGSTKYHAACIINHISTCYSNKKPIK